jgi:hypothetical protein
VGSKEHLLGPENSAPQKEVGYDFVEALHRVKTERSLAGAFSTGCKY